MSKNTRRKGIRIKYILFTVIILIAVTVVNDLVRISGYEAIPMRPTESIHCDQDRVYFDLVNGAKEMDWTRLDGTLAYVAGEYDCADFRLVNLVRILYEFGDRIPKDYKTKIENVLFNFRYWWDEPGENSMCYWSENHQVLFASAEFLIGRLYPDVLFPNSGLTGKQHAQKARTRILDWMEMRWNYGFIEYNSEVYYTEDIGALMNLIDHAHDDEITKKAEIIMDLLFYDMAVQNIHTMMISTSGRSYESQRKGGPDKTVGGLTRYYWGDGQERGPGMTYGMTKNTRYQLPPVIKEIARDTAAVIIKQNNGLDIAELKTEGYFGTDNRSMMMQWGMECFTNPEIVRNSISHIRDHISFNNEFIADFKVLDFTLLNWFHLEPLLVRIINPQSNGVAIQKGNTYTFKTADFSLYTSQQYHPGTFGDQQHLFGLNIRNHFSVFHTHPAMEKGLKHQSPNYWVGYGHIPHTAQDENVNLSVYSIPEKKGLMELDLLDYTLAYFPAGKFDTVLVEGSRALGKRDDTYCALIALNNLQYRDETKEELIQNGKKTYWITEAGSKNRDGSFEAFVHRIRTNKVEFDPTSLELAYWSNEKHYKLKFGEGFYLDGKTVDTRYPRYDSPYIKAEKKDKTLTFEMNDKSLFLDFENLSREFN